MKENEVYSIRKSASSHPHKVTPKAHTPKNTAPIVQPPEPQPVIQAPAVTPSVPVEPVVQAPIQAPEPQVSLEEQTRIDRDEAIALTRSKIAAIHGEQLPEQPTQAEIPQAQAPIITQGYAEEQTLQQQIDPANYHATPDHELPAPIASPAPSTNDYGQFSLPGLIEPKQAAEPTGVPVQHTVVSPVQKPAIKSRLKDKLAKIDHSKIKQQAKSHLDKAKKIKNRVKKAHAEISESDKKFKPIWKKFAPAVSLVLIITLVLNNQLVYGQISYYVTPGNRIERPTIVESKAGSMAPEGERIVIPKINVDVPINYKVKTYEEDAIQKGLEDGIVHYANTGMPGEVGNNVLLGHNTNNFWNSGKYKTAFVLLDRLKEGDTLEIHHKEKRYVYAVYEKKVIDPDNFSVVTQKVTEPIITLITCHPPGTSWERLIIQARQISPEPNQSDKAQGSDLPEGLEGDVPGAAPSVLEDLTGWLF